MTTGERTLLLRGLAILLVAGVVRVALDRTEAGADVLAGLPDAAAALDSAAEQLAADAIERSRPLGAREQIDLNSADEVALDRLPRVGPALAARIVADRAEFGPFDDVSQLVRVAGVGPATLERLRPHLIAGAVTDPGRPLWVSPPLPFERADPRPLVDLNRADSLTLLSISGVGPAMAGRILAARRSHGHFRSLDDLLEVPGIGPRTLERLRAQVTVAGEL